MTDIIDREEIAREIFKYLTANKDTFVAISLLHSEILLRRQEWDLPALKIGRAHV